MRTSRFFFVILLIAAVAAIGSPANAAQVNSAGPLELMEISPDLNCNINHIDDSTGSFYGDTACGTLVAVGGQLFGPEFIPAGGSATPRTPWTPVSQTQGGSGSGADPFKIDTRVTGGGLQIDEADTYVLGQERYRTSVQITNVSATPKTGILYRAADCFLGDDDNGYGYLAGDGKVACRGTDGNGNPGPRLEQWEPITPGSKYLEADYDEVWEWIGSQREFDDSCRCTEEIDNGAGLSWTFSLQPGATKTFEHYTLLSPLGLELPCGTGATALTIGSGKTADLPFQYTECPQVPITRSAALRRGNGDREIVSDTSASTARAFARSAAVTVKIDSVEIDVPGAQSESRCLPGGADTRLTGGAVLVRINGVAFIAGVPAPNSKVAIPGVGELRLNEQRISNREGTSEGEVWGARFIPTEGAEVSVGYAKTSIDC